MLALKLKLTPCRGRRKPKPAVFTWSGDNKGTKRIQFSDTVKIRTTGTVEFGIADKTIKPEDGWVEVDPTSGAYQTFTVSGDGGFEISHANRVSYLYLYSLGSSAITGDITGMKLTYLYLYSLGSSAITGDITGMKLTYLYLRSIGSSVITGDITGMKLTYLYLDSIGSSVITGDITGMELTYLYLESIGSSVITGDITGMKLTYLYLRSIGSSVITGDITRMKLTVLYLENLGSSVITGDITGMKLTSLYLYSIGSSVITGDMGHYINGYIYINNTQPEQRPTWAKTLTVSSLTNSFGFRLVGSVTQLNATESEGLLHAGWDLATNNKVWAQAVLDLASAGDPLDPPPHPEEPGGEDIDTYCRAIYDYGKTITVPAEWGWGNYLEPAVFTWSGDNEGTKRIQFSDTVKIRTTGTVEFGIAGKTIKPEDGWVEVEPTSGAYQTFTVSGDGGFEINRANRVSHLYLNNLGSSVITGDITGMKLTSLYLESLGSSAITGDITGMKLTYLLLNNLGSSVITGDITGMELTYLYLYNLGSSAITGDITGMELTYLLLYNLSSSAITGDITGMKLTYLHLQNLGSSAITGDITGMELTYLRFNNLGSSVLTGDITGMRLTTLQLYAIGSSVITGDMGHYINSYIYIDNTQPEQRPTWAKTLTVSSLTSSIGFGLVGSVTQLNAIESEGLLHACWDLATNNKVWAQAVLNLSSAGDPLDPPPHPEEPGGEDIDTYCRAIYDYGKTITVPAEWGWGNYLDSLGGE